MKKQALNSVFVKFKIMASGPMANRWGKMETDRLYFLGLQNHWSDFMAW